MSRNFKKEKPGASVPSPAKRKLFRWVSMVGLPVLFLMLVEIVLRIAGVGYPTAFFVPAKTGPPGLYTENPRFGWRFFPRRLARAPDPIRLMRTKPPGTCRIFVFGESAALGDPEPAYGFSRILQELLQERCPGTKFEVVNVAMTAVSSHVILRIARDCVPFDGDIWILYMGNNEVVGPFGAGSVFGSREPPRLLIKAGLAAKRTRIGQAVDALFQQIPVRTTAPQHWEGMRMMLQEQIRADDPVLQRVYDNFGNNLDQILSLAHQAGVKPIVCSVSSNLRDCAPFASLNRADLAPGPRAEWRKLVASGTQMQSSNDYPHALAQYRLAFATDKNYAALAFSMAECYLELGDAVNAREYYLRARDLDALRFRADTAINGMIRQVCARQGPGEVRYFDSETVLTNACRLGIPGEECFWDHVHFNFDGNYRMARGLAEQVLAWLPDRLRRGDQRDTPFLTETQCAERLAYTDWDRHAVFEQMWRRVNEPPFTGQMDHQGLLDRWTAWRTQLESTLDAEGLSRATAIYQKALAARPTDWLLHHRLGFLLEARGDLAGASQQWKQVTDLIPDYADAWFKLGGIDSRQSRAQEAMECYQRVLSLRPDSPEALNGLGLVLMNQGRSEEAARSFGLALRSDPEFAQADVNWGLLLARQGQAAQAEIHYRQALQSDPNSVGAHLNLANLLVDQKKYPEAINHYQKAVQLQPAEATTHLALANALEGAGHDTEAIGQFRECIRLNPLLAVAHFNCGVALAKKGDFEGAIVCFQEAARLNPSDPQAPLDLGVALARQGRFPEAVAQFQTVLQLDPGNDAAKRYLQMAAARAEKH